MEMHKRKASKGQDRSPYNRHEDKVMNKAFKSVEKSVAPVAKDTNKTRRKVEKPTDEGTRSPKAAFPKQRK